MAEVALALTSSVVSLLTLTGYTLQGIKYLNGILRDAKGCPHGLDDLETELQALLPIIQSLPDNPTLPEVSSAALLKTLREIASIIEELKITAEQLKIVKESPRRRRIWKRFQQVLSRSQLAKNQERLERWKSTLVLLQGNASMYICIPQF